MQNNNKKKRKTSKCENEKEKNISKRFETKTSEINTINKKETKSLKRTKNVVVVNKNVFDEKQRF